MIRLAQTSLSIRLLFFAWAVLLSSAVFALIAPKLKQQITPSTELLAQHITAPIVVIPYVDHFVSVETVTDKSGDSKTVSKNIYTDHTAVLLPSDLTIDVDVNTDQIATATLTGTFDYQALLAKDTDNERNIRWDKAKMLVGMADLLALQYPITVKWNTLPVETRADTQPIKELGRGFHIKIPETKEVERNPTFEIKLPLRLGSRLSFTPTGNNTDMNILIPNKINANPYGQIKPKITKNSTSLQWQWNIPSIVRGYPDYWVLDAAQSFDLHQAAVGIELLPSSASLISQRLFDWGLIIIGLILAIALAIELMSGQTMHWLHYTMIGNSISLFYVLLAVLEKFAAFTPAFQLAVTLVLSLMSLLMGLILGLRAALLALVLWVGVFISLYVLVTTPLQGLISLLALSSIIMLLITVGSLRFKQTSKVDEDNE